MKIFLLFLFWALWFLSFSSRTILSPILPLIEDDFGISHTLAGGLFLSFFVGNTIAVFSSGFLSFRIGCKRSIFFSFLLLAASFFALKFAVTYYSFAGVLFFLGLGAGIYLPCAIPLITTIFEREYWGKVISFHETAASFSILAIPIITVFALRFFHWRSLFTLMGGACLIVTLFLMAFSPDPRSTKEEQVRLTSILRRKDFWIMTVLWIFCAIGSLGIYNIIPLYLIKERGIPMEAANTIFGFSRVGGFLGIIFIGFVMDRFNLKRILLFTLLATGLFTIGIAMAQAFWVLATMLLAQATFSVVFFPAGIVAISRLTHLSERTMFTGMLMGISSIVGPGLSPFILGLIADAWNFQVGILMMGVLTTLSCLLVKALREI